jgi:hypothetical protein
MDAAGRMRAAVNGHGAIGHCGAGIAARPRGIHIAAASLIATGRLARVEKDRSALASASAAPGA